MNYSNIISEMTWSFSRIKAFEDCPYGFFLKYIVQTKPIRQFFASYGSLMHSILEQYLLEMLQKEELVPYYLSRFKMAVGRPPSPGIFRTYFEQGYDYLSEIQFPHKNILGVERKVLFNIDELPFVGILDYEANDDGVLVLGDHKSRTLKQRSGRTKPTKTDIELDDYYKQLYTYCIPFFEKHGRYPDVLEFNCFRSKQVISEPFSLMKLNDTKEWAKSTIDRIINNEDWSPKIDYWKCRYICDQHENCEYYQMSRR